MDERVWTNSGFGRLLFTAVAVFAIALTFTGGPPGSVPWRGSNIPASLGLCTLALCLALPLWTSKLEARDGTLTATNFFRSRSMPLRDVVHVEWSALPFLGGKICRADGSGIRTLVSGVQWDELWKPRAVKIGEEVLRLADDARREA